LTARSSFRSRRTRSIHQIECRDAHRRAWLLDPGPRLPAGRRDGAGAQFFFWLGRRHGTALLERWPVLARHSEKIRRLIDRHASLAVVAMRFAYGTRIAGPILLGASSMQPLRYLVLNALSAIAWALLIGAAGWFFGEAAEAIFGHLAHVEGWLFGALLAALVAWRLIRRRSVQA